MGNGSGPRVAEDFPQVIARFPRVSVDTNVCIYFLGQVRPWFDACATVFEHAAARRTRIELCGIVQLELLVGTFARPDSNERRRIVDLTERTNGIVTTPISRDALFAAAQLRALTGLKTPDALIVASAALDRSEAIIGNDKAFARVNALQNMSLLDRGTRRITMPHYIHLDDYVEAPRTARARKTDG